jgi:glycosyltransferase involved in cell wall biosynthesis
MTNTNLRPLAHERILLVAEYYPIGGTRTYVKQLLDFYHRMGASLTLVTTMTEPDPEIQQFTANLGFTLIPYSDVVGRPNFSQPSVWSGRRFRVEKRAFRSFAQAQRYTRVVVSAGTPGLLLGALHAKPNGIYILHTYPHGRRQKLLARHYLSYRIPRDSQIVCVSNFQRRIVERLWRTKERGAHVATIVNTCGPELPPNGPLSRPWQVLTVSMVELYKQPIQWVNVAVRVSEMLGRENVRFVWVGDGTLLEEARRYAESFNSVASANFVGSIQDPEDYYRSSHLYLQYSSIENMSLAVIDALRHGIPSVVADVGGLAEIIQNGITGIIVPPSNEEAAATAIESVLRGCTDSTSWQIQTQQQYRLKFSQAQWDEMIMRIHVNEPPG